MSTLHPNPAIKALRPRTQRLHIHVHVPRIRNPPSPPRHTSTLRIPRVWPTSLPTHVPYGRECVYAFSTQAVHPEKHPLSSKFDFDSDSNPGSGSRSRTSPGDAGPVDTEPPGVDFQSLGIGRNARVFLVVFLGAVGCIETWFWCKGIWVWYKGNGNGNGQDGYERK